MGEAIEERRRKVDDTSVQLSECHKELEQVCNGQPCPNGIPASANTIQYIQIHQMRKTRRAVSTLYSQLTDTDIPCHVAHFTLMQVGQGYNTGSPWTTNRQPRGALIARV